jgi:AcrR family transcriptional regulator
LPAVKLVGVEEDVVTNTGPAVVGSRTDERRTDTRQQIRIVAMELFAEHGYDKTSLREIAERLGVTKAAVYYHFRTKEEIVSSLFDDQLAALDEIVAWAGTQPRGPERSRGILERYSNYLAGAGVNPHMIRFLQENQTALKGLSSGADMRARFAELGGLLAGPDASIPELLKMRLSLVAIHFATFAKDDLPGTPEERRTAALEVALELVGADRDRDGMNSHD